MLFASFIMLLTSSALANHHHHLDENRILTVGVLTLPTSQSNLHKLLGLDSPLLKL